MSDFLLDTCAVIWVANNEDLQEPALSELPKACARGSRLFVSPMTAWEIAVLVAKGRIALTNSPDIWFERFCERPEMALAEMLPSVLVASTILPGMPPSDPVDRITCNDGTGVRIHFSNTRQASARVLHQRSHQSDRMLKSLYVKKWIDSSNVTPLFRTGICRVLKSAPRSL